MSIAGGISAFDAGAARYCLVVACFGGPSRERARINKVTNAVLTISQRVVALA